MTEYYDDKMQRHIRKSIRCGYKPINRNVYEIPDHGKGGIVDLEKGICTCRKWQLEQFPCRHLCKIAASHRLDNCYQWVNRYYKNETAILAYAEPINPVGHQSEWKVAETAMKVLPPKKGAPKVGRPKSQKRIPSRGEEERHPRCSRCGITGHNRLQCSSQLPLPTRIPSTISSSVASCSKSAGK